MNYLNTYFLEGEGPSFPELIPYIVIFVGVALVIGVVLSRIFRRSREETPAKEISKSAYIEALGGEENIIEKSITGSRISLVLKDYEKIDREKIKEAGVDGFIMMSNKLTLVIKGNASEVYKTLFGE